MKGKLRKAVCVVGGFSLIAAIPTAASAAWWGDAPGAGAGPRCGQAMPGGHVTVPCWIFWWPRAEPVMG